MADGERLDGKEAPVARLARSAGISDAKNLSLTQVDKRRTQLWSISIFLVAGVTIALVLTTLGIEGLPISLDLRDPSSWVIVVLVSGLVLAFLVYVVEKERSLRDLTQLLVEERVLSAALSNRLAEISALSEVGKAINTTLELQDVLRVILTSALDLLEGTEGSIMLLDDSGDELEVVSYYGPRTEEVVGKSVPVGLDIAGSVAQRRQPLLLQGGDVEEFRPNGARPERDIHSSMCVPLIRQNELLGILNVNETKGKRRFTEQDLNALGLFAEHAAIAIGNARQFEKEREAVVRLEELDRLKSDFVATVSHELRTPLTAIIAAATALSRRADRMDAEQQGVFTEMIERQGKRLSNLVDGVLTAASIEAGMPRLRRELVDLGRVASEVVEDLRHSQRAQGRELVLTIDPERPHAWGNAGAIHQILTNLGENALKYSEEGPVTVSVREIPSGVTMSVADRGRGIPQELIGSIFDRFRQLDSSPTRAVGGVGLGLHIVKSLVDAHNGEIDVSSTEGEGTIFTVTLPERGK